MKQRGREATKGPSAPEVDQLRLRREGNPDLQSFGCNHSQLDLCHAVVMN